MLCSVKPAVGVPVNSTADWYGRLSTTGDGEATPAAADGDGATEAAGEAAGLTAATADGDGDAAASGDGATVAWVGFAGGAGGLVGDEGAAEPQPAMTSMAATSSVEVRGTFQFPRE